MYYLVKFTGAFGFIKPWTAVRDSFTFSQQFLTPSIIEGIRQKLEVKEILRHRLRYNGISVQQEKTESRAYKKSKGAIVQKETSVLKRGVLISPELILAFSGESDAMKATKQHICLCRNEDILYPVKTDSIIRVSPEEFEKIEGFEFIPTVPNDNEAFLVGFNRFENSSPMYGKLLIIGDPANYTPKDDSYV